MKRIYLVSLVLGTALFLFAIAMLIFASIDLKFDLPFKTVRFSMVAGIVLALISVPGLAKTKEQRGFEVKLTGQPPVLREKEKNDHG
jgi:hypothetical protein